MHTPHTSHRVPVDTGGPGSCACLSYTHAKQLCAPTHLVWAPATARSRALLWRPWAAVAPGRTSTASWPALRTWCACGRPDRPSSSPSRRERRPWPHAGASVRLQHERAAVKRHQSTRPSLAGAPTANETIPQGSNTCKGTRGPVHHRRFTGVSQACRTVRVNEVAAIRRSGRVMAVRCLI